MSLLSIAKKSWKLPLISIAGLVFALFFVLGRPEAEVHVPLVTPPQTPYAQAVAGIGVVEPKSELVSVGTELAGVVREVHVKVGDDVEKDAPLFSLDQRDIDAQIAVLEAGLKTAKLQFDDVAAQFAIVNSFKDKRAVSKDDYNRRKFAKQIAATKIDEIAAQLEQAKTTKQRMTVKAPIAGEILEVNIRAGEYANTGVANLPLILMGDVSTYHVRVEIDEENAARVSQKDSAKASLRGNPEKKYELEFVRFEPYVRAKQNLANAGQRVDTRVLRVIYALPKNVDGVFVGQQMDVFIEEQNAKK